MLTEFNRSLPELLCPDEDFGNQDVMDTNHTEAEAESLKRNAEVLLKISDITAAFYSLVTISREKVSKRVFTAFTLWLTFSNHYFFNHDNLQLFLLIYY